MATGEIKWSSKGKKVERFSFEPVPAGDYDLKLNAESVTIKKGNEPGKLPYVSVSFEALGTAQSESGKNRRIFHNFFLHLEPSEKDGKNMVERQGGLLDLSASLGQDIEVTGVMAQYQKYDAKGAKVGEMRRVPIADAKQVVAWLQSLDGAVLKAKVKVEKGNGDYGPQNRIDYFIPSEDAATEETSEEYSMDAESEEEESTEEVEETEEEAPEEEEVPVKKFVKAPPAKVKQGPAAKGKSKR